MIVKVKLDLVTKMFVNNDRQLVADKSYIQILVRYYLTTIIHIIKTIVTIM